nr:GIY-YIG nuclease family protein [Mycobacterium sp. E3298]
MGIYQITNTKNGRRYIGSSINIIKRWEKHIHDLTYKTHHSYKLQDDWSKFGATSFAFSILEVVINKSSLTNIEQSYLDEEDINELYNIVDNTKFKTTATSQEYIENINYVDQLNTEIKMKLKQNIRVFDKKHSFIRIGKNSTDLSKAWFLKSNENAVMIKKAMKNYFINHEKVKGNQIYWTSFIQLFNKLLNRGTTKSFLSMNAEVDNSNRRNTLCFAANCYPNSFLKNRYKKEGIEIDDGKYALSILIRWIENVSDINKEIKIYLPSYRMEKLLIDWIKE